MLDKIRNFWEVLEKEQKNNIIITQISVIFLAFFELTIITSIAYYMQLVTNGSKLENAIDIFPFFKDLSKNETLLVVSLSLVLLLTVGSLFSALLYRKSIKLSMTIGHEIACRLMRFYLSKDWIYYTCNNSSKIMNNVLMESNRLSHGVILPLLTIVSRVILIFVTSIAIFIYNPKITILVLAFFMISYGLISRMVKGKLFSNSIIINSSSREQIKTLHEVVDNIKMVILDDKSTFFYERFKLNNGKVAACQSSNIILASSPRYVMEWLAYVSMILIIIISIISGDNLNTIIPLLTIYGLAAFKLLPSIQQVYSGLSTIKGNVSALENINEDLRHSYSLKLVSNVKRDISFNRNINVDNLTFAYPNKALSSLTQLNLNVNKNQTIGIVGESGSGKSTLIDTICGLLPIQDGDINVDGVSINDDMESWRKNVAYVPQSITLSDSSIAENIAFGIGIDQIDQNWLNEVIALSCLNDFILSLEDGIFTNVGEKGVQLSGGQRQRIGIARALYKRASLLVLDEATSALDGITENKIMQAIKKLSGTMTIIIIAHRLKTIKECDCIYMLKNGAVIDSGSYDSLMSNNKEFRKMERFA